MTNSRMKNVANITYEYKADKQGATQKESIQTEVAATELVVQPLLYFEKQTVRELAARMDIITYSILITLQDGAELIKVMVEDHLVDEIDYVNDLAKAYINGEEASIEEIAQSQYTRFFHVRKKDDSPIKVGSLIEINYKAQIREENIPDPEGSPQPDPLLGTYLVTTAKLGYEDVNGNILDPSESTISSSTSTLVSQARIWGDLKLSDEYPSPQVAGDPIEYIVTLTNTGNEAAVELSIAQLLPIRMQLLSEGAVVVYNIKGDIRIQETDILISLDEDSNRLTVSKIVVEAKVVENENQFGITQVIIKGTYMGL